jgi:hypothetical protein
VIALGQTRQSSGRRRHGKPADRGVWLALVFHAFHSNIQPNCRTGSGALSSPRANGEDQPVWNRRHRSRCSILLTSQNTWMLPATNKTPELIPKSDLHGARCGYVFPYNDAASASMSCRPCSGSSIALSRMPKAVRRTPARPWFCSRQRSDPQEMIAPLRSKVSRASARFSQCALEFARTGLRRALEGLWRRCAGAPKLRSAKTACRALESTIAA